MSAMMASMGTAQIDVSKPTTAAELFLRNEESDAIAAHLEERSLAYRELARRPTRFRSDTHDL